MDNKLTLKNNLKQHRQNKNLSQEDLARLVGTSRQTIIAIEKNIFNPSTKLALLLSIALDTTVEKIFYIE